MPDVLLTAPGTARAFGMPQGKRDEDRKALKTIRNYYHRALDSRRCRNDRIPD